MANGIVDTMKSELIQIDKAGRLVLPKPLREQFNLVPGDKLRVSVEGNGFRLEPTESGGKLVKEGSVLVFAGAFAEAVTTEKVTKLLEGEREERLGVPMEVKRKR